MSIATLAGPRRRADFAPKSRFGPAAIAVMVGFHLILGYALVNGLGKHVVEVLKKPLDATIIQEVKLPPPPPPPEPPKPVAKEAPKLEPPPPAYVPPPDVAPPPAADAAPAITEVQSAAPVAPPPPAPPAPEAPPPPPPAPPMPVRQDIAVVCPQQARPSIPARALEEGISGTVRAEVKIRGGRVVDARIVSGPKVFHGAVQSALAQYQCQTSGSEEILASQSFEFKVE